MSTDLEDFAAHARYMATARHRDDCPSQRPAPITHRSRDEITLTFTLCRGCVTDTDRALWARLADEVDAWLGRDEQEGLFE